MVPAPGKVWPAAKVIAPVKLALPCTSSFAAGAVVPIPTRVSAVAPFTPLILPSTMALLAVTCALAPIAVALLRAGWPESGPAFAPRAVLFDPVVFDER